MTRFFLRSLNVGLMVVSGLLAFRLGADLHRELAADTAQATEGASAPVSEGEARVSVADGDGRTRGLGEPASWSERAVILERNLFHDPLSSPQTLAAQAPAEVVESTELPLGLLGTIASTDSDIGAAAVWNAKRKRRVVVTEGDELAGGRAVVVGIERQRLLLSEDGIVRELVLAENEDVRPPKRPTRRRGRTGRRRALRR